MVGTASYFDFVFFWTVELGNLNRNNSVYRIIFHQQLWDLRQRKLIQQFRGHDSDVRAAIFLHQQQVTWKRLVLSCSSDRTARLWDLNTGSELKEFCINKYKY